MEATGFAILWFEYFIFVIRLFFIYIGLLNSCYFFPVGLTNPLYPYAPSPPLDTLYVPEPLQTHDEPLYETDYGAGVGTYDLYMQVRFCFKIVSLTY